MKAIGQIEIEEGLILNNPTLNNPTVNYNWETYMVDVQCIFNEENAIYRHSRVFTFPTLGDGELTSDDIISLIKGHHILNVFK